MSMTTTVIINNYNYGRFLAECIESVLAQKMQATEVICVDDGSIDDSHNILARYREKITLISQRNLGQFRALLTGVEAASGELCFFLDADDTWNSDHIQKIYQAFETDEDQSLVSSSLSCFGQYEGLHPLSEMHPSIAYARTQAITFLNGNFVGRPTSTCAMKRLDALSILEKAQSLQKHFRVCADEVLVYGTSLMGRKTTLLKDATVNYRVHSDNHFFKNTDERDKSEERKRRGILFSHFQKLENFTCKPQEIYREMCLNNSTALQKKYRKIMRHIPDMGLMGYYWRLRFRLWKKLK
jgi:glycosyltransferase involved in cell wall biosynthesis